MRRKNAEVSCLSVRFIIPLSTHCPAFFDNRARNYEVCEKVLVTSPILHFRKTPR
jgi:hypothetical protein